MTFTVTVSPVGGPPKHDQARTKTSMWIAVLLRLACLLHLQVAVTLDGAAHHVERENAPSDDTKNGKMLCNRQLNSERLDTLTGRVHDMQQPRSEPNSSDLFQTSKECLLLDFGGLLV